MKKNTSQAIFSVTELNNRVRTLLETHYDWIWVEGELSNFRKPTSGHWYFTLKDQKAQIRCAMFKNRNTRNSKSPKDGDKVRLRGKISLYEARGDYQLIADHFELVGHGDQQAALELLKRKLFQEGIFSQDQKKSIPTFINKVVLITSSTGAAIQDILKTLNRRCPDIEVYIYAVSVQGPTAAKEISDGFKQIDQWVESSLINIDVIILARGGGSIEDLNAFNDESVGRAIFNCTTPVISAVGHEIDVSISDLASDLRAATPTAAAELISPDLSVLIGSLNKYSQQLEKAIKSVVSAKQRETKHLRKRLKHPKSLLDDQSQNIDQLEFLLIKSIQDRIKQQSMHFSSQRDRLLSNSPLQKIAIFLDHLENKTSLLSHRIKQKIFLLENQILHTKELLETINPKSMLNRGYSIITTGRGKIIKNQSEAKSGTHLIALMAAGTLHVKASHWDDNSEK